MKEKPILMSAPMVLALLDHRKTQTRRIMKPQPIVHRQLTHGKVLHEEENQYQESFEWHHPKVTEAGYCHTDYEAFRRLALPHCPYGVPGDRLWLRETFALFTDGSGAKNVWYAASDAYLGPWKPSIFMPRWASRITLEITNVRVQRLHEISEEDALAEGCLEPEPAHGHWCDPAKGREGHWSYRKSYCTLWESINGKDSWNRNPWVWAVSFRII